MGRSFVRAAVVAIVAVVGAFTFSFTAPPARADINSDVTQFVNDSANWGRIEGSLNGSTTYQSSDAAIAAGTDGASIEQFFLDVRTAEGILPTSFVEGDAAFTAAFPEIGIPVNVTGATVVATGLVVTGLGTTLFQKFLGDWDSASGGNLAIGRWVLLHRNPGSYTYPYPSGPKLIPHVDGDYVWCWQANDTPNRASCGNLTEWATSPDSGENQAYNAARLMHRGALLGPYDLSYPYALDPSTYFREVTPSELRSTLTAASPLRPQAAEDCSGITCVTYTGTPMNVTSGSTTANDTRTTILNNPEGARAIVHIVTTDDPRQDDPTVPAPGNDCSLRVDDPHLSQGTPGAVDAKGYVTCTYSTTVTVSMKLWKCDTAPTIFDEFALDVGDSGCTHVATEVAARTVLAGEEAAPVQVPPPLGEVIPGDGKYFVALGECDLATPSAVWSNVRQLG